MANEPDPQIIEPPIKVEQQGEGLVATLRTIEEVAQFFQREVRLSQEMGGSTGALPGFGSSAPREQQNWAAQGERLAQQLRQSANNSAQRKASIEELRSSIQTVAQGRVISAHSVEGKKLAHLVSLGRPEAAAIRLARLLQGQFGPPDRQSSPWAYAAVRDLSADQPDTVSSALLSAFQERIAEMQKAFVAAERSVQAAVTNAETSKRELDARVQRADTELARFKDQHGALIAAHETRQAELIEGATKELDAFKQTMKTELQIQAPVEYWTKKARAHGSARWWWFAIFSAAVAALIIVIERWGPDALAALPKTSAGGYDLPSLVLIGAPVVVYLWLLRYLGRFVLTNFAGKHDAELRATMANTFLALVADPQSGVGQAERLIVLHALFRPRAGESDEDAPPPNLLELIQQAISRKP